jgi:hypothetical protein
MGACPSPACRDPARRPTCDSVQAAPFGHLGWLAFVPGHDVNLIDLHLTFQRHLRGLGGQAAAQLRRHSLHVRGVQTQLQSNLPVREVQAHEVEARNPDPQRLMMTGQHRAGEVVEAPRTRFAPIPLPVPLRVVAPVADHHAAAAPGATNTLWPAMPAHQRKALGIVQECREIVYVRCSHMAEAPCASSSATPAPAIAPDLVNPAPQSQPHHPGTQ